MLGFSIGLQFNFDCAREVTPVTPGKKRTNKQTTAGFVLVATGGYDSDTEQHFPEPRVLLNAKTCPRSSGSAEQRTNFGAGPIISQENVTARNFPTRQPLSEKTATLCQEAERAKPTGVWATMEPL